MKTSLRIIPLLFGAACLTTAAAFADARTDAYNGPGDIHMNIDLDSDSQIHMDGDDVVITAHDGSKARISPAGDLSIGGSAVAVDDGQRKLLRRYALGIHNIEDRGMQIGRDALHLAGGVIGAVVADLFSEDGVDDKQIDRDAKQQAEPIKQEALALCKDVKSEKQVQTALVAQLPAFKPYAVIDTKPDHDCHVDDNDIEV